MTRKPLFWILLVVLSVVAAWFTFVYFPKAFPIVNVDIRMSRQNALSEAQRLADQQNWGPSPFQQAASFSLDSQVQHFVELEAGGVEKFNELLKGKLYAPYKWVVRHFQENEKTETLLRFTPAGEFYGFTIKLPENQPGAALSADSALTLARAGAARWNVDLSPFSVVEKSQETQIGGRVDHKFTLERTDQTLGEGFYRLDLTVAGDELAGLRHYVKVPEAFQRRYQEMRSSNDTLASVAMFAIAVLYGILGIGFGLFYLLRIRWLKWRTALVWGCFIALLQVLTMLNQWSFLWMSYDTALSHSSFFMQQILQLVLVFFGEAVLLTLTFMAAEGLTRKAFPQQIQFWKIWNPKVASTKPVLGFTIGGYLGVTLFFAFDIALYFFATKILGWWTPSSSLFDPDVLATYQPWLSSIAISLHAGFWEECLFRAIPIAGAALIGRKFGKEKLWIAGAFLVQAVIFGAGHANYATQPSYARVVELILPSIAFGLLYLYLGLLPAIILHFAYDVVWFALPLFVSSAPNIWIHQALVIVFTLVPLWVVFWARLRRKQWGDEVPEAFKNKAFEPPVHKELPELETPLPASSTVKTSVNVWLVVAGLVSIIVWGLFVNARNVAPPLEVNRSEAETLAAEELEQRDIELSQEWKQLSRVEVPLNQNDRFVWQEEGDSVYASLMGSYLGGPRWLVRYAMFEGDVVARAEEYSVAIPNTQEQWFSHKLPESAPGDSLSEQVARAIAEQALAEKFDLQAENLKNVSVTPTKLENRMDWQFVWADTARHPLQSGECRLVIQLAGSEVVNAYQTVHVPEVWSRAEREQNNILNILDTIVAVFPILFLVAALVFAIISWSRKQFNVGVFLKIAILLSVIMLVQLYNNWPSVKSMFMTAAPWEHQALLAIIFSILGALVAGATIGMVNGYITATQGNMVKSSVAKPVAALGAGLVIVAIVALLRSLAPSLVPPWTDYSDLGARWPLVSLAIGSINRLFVNGTVYLLIFAVLDRFTQSWHRRQVPALLILLLVGSLLTDVSASGTIPFWLLIGAVKGLLLWLAFVVVLRHRLSVAPFVVLPALLASQVVGFWRDAFPGAQVGYAVAFVILLGVAFLWERWLRTENR